MIAAIVKDSGFEMPEHPKEFQDELFSEKFACPVCNISLPEIEPRIFSFNTPHGACPTCNGLGTVLAVDEDLVFNNNLTINEGGIMPFANAVMHETWFTRTLKSFCEDNHIPLDVKIEFLPDMQKVLLLKGTGKKQYEVIGENRWGTTTRIHEAFYGIIDEVNKRYTGTESLFMKSHIEKFMRYEVCETCHGARLKKEALSVTLEGKSIVEVSDLAISKSLAFII